MEIRSDRTYRFELAPDELWTALGRVGDYPRWWSWLVGFDGRRLAAGEVWTCAVRPPLPYTVRFRIALDEVDAPHRIAAHLDGDLTGTAELCVADADPGPGLQHAAGGSEVRLTASLAPAQRWLAAVAGLSGPLVRWGHDWVLDTGARQFADHHHGGGDGRADITPHRAATPDRRA
jgi:hypothetical protein